VITKLAKKIAKKFFSALTKQPSVTRAKVIWRNWRHRSYAKVTLSIFSIVFARWQHASRSCFWSAFGTSILEKVRSEEGSDGTVRNSEGGFL